MLQDSGARRKFDTGAVRDISQGKGRCDLLPLDVIGDIYTDGILSDLYNAVHAKNVKQLEYFIKEILTEFTSIYFDNMWTSLLELSKHYEDGAAKYSERNWEKGLPLHCFFDSGARHYIKFMRGDGDEPHDRAFLWNIYGALWTIKHHPELIDLPELESPPVENNGEV